MTKLPDTDKFHSDNHRAIFIELDHRYQAELMVRPSEDDLCRSLAIDFVARKYCRRIGQLIAADDHPQGTELMSLLSSLDAPDDEPLSERVTRGFIGNVQIALLPAFKDFLRQYWHPTPLREGEVCTNARRELHRTLNALTSMASPGLPVLETCEAIAAYERAQGASK